MFQLIITGLIIYAGYKIWKAMTAKPPSGTEVHGNPTQKPLNIDPSDVEDAKYEDIDD